jgi:hypothetical protein
MFLSLRSLLCPLLAMLDLLVLLWSLSLLGSALIEKVISLGDALSPQTD